jgi:hypothetical protein
MRSTAPAPTEAPLGTMLHAGQESGVRHTAVILSDSRLSTLRLKATCALASNTGDISQGPHLPVPWRHHTLAPRTSMPRNTMFVSTWHYHDETTHLRVLVCASHRGICTPPPGPSPIPHIHRAIRPRPLQMPGAIEHTAAQVEKILHRPAV